jgi:alkaline phosphatase D
MSIPMNRRRFLELAAAAPAALGYRGPHPSQGAGAPAIVTSERLRPVITSGVQSGDVTADRAILWSRADRPSRLVVEYATNEAMRDATQVIGPAALDVSDFTARVDLAGLPPGDMVFYRVRFESLTHRGAWSEPASGRFRTAPLDRRTIKLVWTGDTVGQGWGINREWGGLRGYETMLAAEPDVFVHSGDMIYADNPLSPEVGLSNGRVWKNLVTAAKSKVAETLDDFRGNYAYNLLDEHVRRFNAAVPILAQWDDHEVLNNWYPGMSLDDNARFSEKSIALLAARAKRAMFEYVPLRAHPDEAERVYRALSFGPSLDVFLLDERTYRGPNTGNRQASTGPETRMLGRAQVEWLKGALRASQATWKVIASDMPVGLIVRDGARRGEPAFEAWANGEGPPLGRELELAELLAFAKAQGIRNLIWITADVHYAAALRYDPARASFTEFLPFWEFVAGPIHAGSFGPNPVDPTFGPEVVYQSAQPGGPQNRPPSDGHQYFGTLTVDGRTRRLTAGLFNLTGEKVYGVDLDP